jgi:hypothetical protein
MVEHALLRRKSCRQTAAAVTGMQKGGSRRHQAEIAFPGAVGKRISARSFELGRYNPLQMVFYIFPPSPSSLSLLNAVAAEWHRFLTKYKRAISQLWIPWQENAEVKSSE